jgi:hypothetical protein
VPTTRTLGEAHTAVTRAAERVLIRTFAPGDLERAALGQCSPEMRARLHACLALAMEGATDYELEQTLDPSCQRAN